MKTILKTTIALALFMLSACNNANQPENEISVEKTRKELLVSTVETYIKGIKERDFSIIPYAENVTMRTPFTEKEPKRN
jgi:hypothetical protein